MLICVDVGATKTLMAVAVFDEDGLRFESREQISTPQKRNELLSLIGDFLQQHNGTTLSIAVPGKVSQKKEIASLANREWHEFEIIKELKEFVPAKTAIYFENDANLAALSEAIEGAGSHADSVYYVTISTGIGGGFVANKRLSQDVLNTEPGHMVFKREDSYAIWEEFASGRAFVERFGDIAENIEDQSTWKTFAEDLAPGFVEISTMFNPECIVVGGSVGAQFTKYETLLLEKINEIKSQYISVPEILQAKNPNDAVIRGCHYYATTYY